MMARPFWSMNEVLDFAIAREVEANRFYTDLAARMEVPAVTTVFREFAAEELGHKAKLEAVKRGEYVFEMGAGPARGLGLTEYLVEGELTPDMSYPDALILAMKKEKASYRLYMDLAAMAGDAATQGLFLTLAGEEAKHKLRFEIEYDDYVLKQG
jgi:rubrerythrin